MGNCCFPCNKYDNNFYNISLKFPHNTEYIEYSNIDKKFIKYDNINIWI